MTTANTCNPISLRGLWLPLISPFRDGELDEVSLTRLVSYYNEQAIDGLFVAATTGEGLTLTADETERVVRTVAAANRGRPLFLGVCGSDTRKLAQWIATTKSWPVDGYLVTCPYYSRPSQEGIYQHFSALAQATDRAVVMYNIPYRTGVNMSNATLLRLAEHRNIIGLKDCCADAAQSFDLMRTRPADFHVLTGEDAMFFAALCQGAEGGILASAHVQTQAFADVAQALADNDLALARARWQELCDVPQLLFREPSPAAIKYWLWRQGLIDSPEVRLPIMQVSAGLASALDKAVAKG